MLNRKFGAGLVVVVALVCSYGCDRAGSGVEQAEEHAEAAQAEEELESDERAGEDVPDEPPPPPGHSMESIFASLDWDEDGMINCGELRQAQCFGNGGMLFAEAVGYTTPLSPSACSRHAACAALLARGMEFDETLITRDELVAAFMQLDADGDGVVTCAEVPDAGSCFEGDENTVIAFNDCIGDMGCQPQIPFDGWFGETVEVNDEREEVEPVLDATGDEQPESAE